MARIDANDETVATDAKWTIQTRDRVDASAFGEANARYLTGLRDISGTFSGLLDGDGSTRLFADPPEETELNLYAHARPAWWGRLKHWLLREPWPEYVVSSGRVRWTTIEAVDGTVEGSFYYVGPVTLHAQPVSRLERFWGRVCHPLR